MEQIEIITYVNMQILLIFRTSFYFHFISSLRVQFFPRSNFLRFIPRGFGLNVGHCEWMLRTFDFSNFVEIAKFQTINSCSIQHKLKQAISEALET